MGPDMSPSPFPLHFVLLWSGSFLLPLRVPTTPATSDAVLEPLIQPCRGWLLVAAHFLTTVSQDED